MSGLAGSNVMFFVDDISHASDGANGVADGDEDRKTLRRQLIEDMEQNSSNQQAGRDQQSQNALRDDHDSLSDTDRSIMEAEDKLHAICPKPSRQRIATVSARSSTMHD